MRRATSVPLPAIAGKSMQRHRRLPRWPWRAIPAAPPLITSPRTARLALAAWKRTPAWHISSDGGVTWTNTFIAQEGPNSVQVRQTDVAGNVGAVGTLNFTLDTAAPPAPGVALTNDTGSSPIDNITQKGSAERQRGVRCQCGVLDRQGGHLG